MLRRLNDAAWSWIARRVVRAALRNVTARAELQGFVDECVRRQMLGPFELKRRG